MSNETAKCNDQPATKRSCPDPTGSEPPILSESEEYEKYENAVAVYESLGDNGSLLAMQEAYQRYKIAYEMNSSNPPQNA